MSNDARSAAAKVKVQPGPLTEGQKLLTKASKALRAAAALPVDDALGRQQGLALAIEALKAANRHLEALEDIEAALRVGADRQFQELELAFRDECASRGWHVGGQWPEFQIAYGAKILFDEKTRHVKVAGRDIGAVGIQTLAEAMQKVVQQLVPARFDPAAFLNDLSSAYDQALLGGSGLVPIFALHKMMAIRAQGEKFWRNPSREQFQVLTSDQFRARLGATLSANAIVDAQGRALRLHPALGSTDALFVYQPAERRYGWVGSLDFIHERPESAA